MIQTIQLHGTDKQLYKIVAPLVMDPEVLKMNNNYPLRLLISLSGLLPQVGNMWLDFFR